MSLFVLALLVTWPTPPWEVLWWAGGLFMITAPVIFYPFAKLLFLAFDLSFRPARPEELTAGGSTCPALLARTGKPCFFTTASSFSAIPLGRFAPVSIFSMVLSLVFR